MQGTTVRLSGSAYKSLKELAAQEEQSLQGILEKAIDQYRQQRFWDQFDAAYTALQQNPKAWEEECQERQLWEATLMDDIDPEDSSGEDGPISHHE